MRISIVIAYNRDRGFLKEAIKSAEAQDFDDYEIIVHQGNFNFSKNLNDAIKKAKGEYVKLLNEDDLLLPNCLKDLHKGIRGFDFVNADIMNFGINDMWWGDMEYHESIHKGKLTNFAEMLFRNQLNQVSIMYRTDILFEIGGFDETLNTAEDYDINLLLLKKGYKLGYIPKVVGKYRVHETNKSINLDTEAFHERKRKIKQLMQERYG